MTQVAIVGCGVIGAMIAYELSQIPHLNITVFDRQAPAQASTGAALGVLMGAISQKQKGDRLHMRLASIQRYNTLIPELQAKTGHAIPFNQQGILRLCFAEDDLTSWQKLIALRQTQGWHLEILDQTQLQATYPHIQNERVLAAIHSRDDRQVDPVALTLALITAAQQQGVIFQFNTKVEQLTSSPQTEHPSLQTCQQLHTSSGSFSVDWVIVAAGLGSTPLTASLHSPIDLRPVLGQALHIQLPQPLQLTAEPVITGEDIHIVPLGQGSYWIGATVEFLANELDPEKIVPDPDRLQPLLQGAISFCPALATGTIGKTWSGLRPRPEGRPAPIIECLPGYQNVLLATGHYRNGILLAPATAQKVKEMMSLNEAHSGYRPSSLP
ncbi:MAG: FAD-binding oxidoreductase [Scytolyngbya sp. HA4215-MV1]|nr:FAD-binding oxidoreductase [Scytolyngbya sp. HA4215-MV1]